MDREETAKILSVLRAAYPKFYAGMSRQELENIVTLWQRSFTEHYSVVTAAVQSLIESDEKGFPPVIGQVKAKIRLLTRRQGMTEAEAWGMVSRAVSNGLYGSSEEFDKLPTALQKIVGSPAQLREWAMMDSDTLHSVVASNFQRSYKIVAAREEEVAKLPKAVRQAVGMLGSQAEEKAPALPARYSSEEDTLRQLEASRRAHWEKLKSEDAKKERRKEDIIKALRSGKKDLNG